MALQVGDCFPGISTARLAIQTFVATNREISKIVKSDKSRFLLAYKSEECTFEIRATSSKKRGISITYIEPYACSPATHYIAPYTNTFLFLIPHYRLAVIHNPKITTKHTQSNERL